MAVAVFGAVGCAHERPASVLPGPEVETATAIDFRDHLPHSIVLDDLWVVLDGETVYRKALGVAPYVAVFRGRLPEGDHVVQVKATMHLPCGVTPEPHETLVVRHAHAFDVGPGGGRVDVDLFAREPWLDPSMGVSLDFRTRGMRHGRAVARYDDESVRACDQESGIAHARCLVRAMLDDSIARRDVVAASCHDEKLAAIDALSEAADREQSEQRARELAREAAQCIGQLVGWMGGQSVTLDRARCSGYGDAVPD